MAAEHIAPAPEPLIGSILVEDIPVHPLRQARNWLYANRGYIAVAAVVVGSLWINRALMRKDLKRLNFTAEFYPDWMFDGEGEFVGIGE